MLRPLFSDLVGLADHWIGFGWIGYGWTGFCRFITLDWIGLIGLEAPGAPVVITYTTLENDESVIWRSEPISPSRVLQKTCRVYLVRLIIMVNLHFVVLLAKIAYTRAAVMASAITQFFGRSVFSTLNVVGLH
jgi:hypothetical protein